MADEPNSLRKKGVHLSSVDYRSLSILEKIKAGLGVAGLSAVGTDVTLSQLASGLTSAQSYGATAIVAIAAGLLGARLTNVPNKEAALDAKAKRESVIDSHG